MPLKPLGFFMAERGFCAHHLEFLTSCACLDGNNLSYAGNCSVLLAGWLHDVVKEIAMGMCLEVPWDHRPSWNIFIAWSQFEAKGGGVLMKVLNGPPTKPPATHPLGKVVLSVQLSLHGFILV